MKTTGLALCALLMFVVTPVARGESPALPVEVRAEMLTVTPATGPLLHVLVRNAGAEDFAGELAVTFPEGWKVNKPRQAIRVAAGQTARVAFAIEKGVNSADNAYPLVLAVAGAGGKTATFRQTVACASAPYLDVKADGQFDDWKDAIPLSFTTAGRRTVLYTAWTRRALHLRVDVEEDARRLMDEPAAGAGEGKGAFDAVQVAIAPREARTPRAAGEKLERFEFLLVGTAGEPTCFALARPGDAAAEAPVDLGSREAPGVKLAVRREGTWTRYECSVPFKGLGGLEPDPGREFCLSVLVHDPDGTGVRDRGAAAGLWAGQRTRWGWTRWAGARWGREEPFDSAIEWGFCSSAQ